MTNLSLILKYTLAVSLFSGGFTGLYAQNSAADRYYQDRITSGITNGKNKHDSFVVAQQRLRQEYNDPFYWAAFIMLD